MLAYEGKLKQAYRIYKSILRKEYSIDTVFEVEEFMIWVLQEKPEKYQLHFILGIINFYFKEDFNQAKLDLIKFLELSQNNYQEEIEISNKLLEEIMKKGSSTNSQL